MKRFKHLIPLTLFSLLFSACTPATPTGDEDIHVTSISLNEDNKELYVDDTFQLVATVLPDNATKKEFTWSYSGDAISLENGLVTALKEGSATVTVTTVDGGLTDSCNFTVSNRPIDHISVTGVSLNHSSLELTVGDTVNFNATISPSNATNKEVIWSSSKSSIISIDDNGVAEAKASGTAKITVTTVDSNKTATCNVTVNPSTVAVSGVTLDQSTLALKVGETSTLTATVLPNDATNKEVTWSSSKTSVATVSNGVVTAIAEGSADITVKTVDGNKTAKCTVTVTKDVQPQSDTFILNTDLPEVGTRVIFGASKNGKTYALSVDSNSSKTNRKAVEVTLNNDTIELEDKVAVFEIQEGTTDGTYAFYDLTNEGYLTAKSSSSNSLGLSSSKNANTSFTVTEGKNKTIVSQGSYTRNTLFYNSSNTIFNLYDGSSSSSIYSLPNLYTTVGNPVYATAITVNGDASMFVGDTQKLSLGFTPSDTNKKTATWSSNNTSVATVNNGTVTALKAGIARITATVVGVNNTTVSNYIDIQVRNVPVTGVSLDKTSAELGLTRTLTLTATVSPSNATDKSVTWSSSNTSVATVSNGVVTPKALGNTVITVKTNDGNKTATCNVNVVELALDEWTILVYVSGSNLESDGGAATADMAEVLSVKNQPDNVNVVYQTGGTTSWKNYGISSKKVQRWEVKNQSLTLAKDMGKQMNMAASATLQDFVEWGLTEYPAQKTGLIFWNHGGAMAGCCVDDNYSSGYTYDYLTNSETKTALTNAFRTVGRTDKLEFVGYDCCVMQVQDIADFNSEFFNYMIASEELENGDGWDYSSWIDDVYAGKSTEDILKANCDGFISFYNSSSNGYSSSSNDQTLSALNLTYMAEYKNAWETFASAFKTNVATLESSSKGSFYKFLRNKVKYYGTSGYTQGYEDVGTFDVGDFLTKVKANSTLYSGMSTYISAIESAYANLLVYNKIGSKAGNSTGLSFFFDSGRCFFFFLFR